MCKEVYINSQDQNIKSEKNNEWLIYYISRCYNLRLLYSAG